MMKVLSIAYFTAGVLNQNKPNNLINNNQKCFFLICILCVLSVYIIQMFADSKIF